MESCSDNNESFVNYNLIKDLPRSKLNGYKSRWWWFTIQFKNQKRLLKWSPEKLGKIKYAAWRGHLSPTTAKPHIHCLVNFTTTVRDISLAKTKGIDATNLQFF